MIICISGLLNASALNQIRSLLDDARFDSGAATAGWHARLVKANRQASAQDPLARQAAALVIGALQANAVFRAAARPRRFCPPLFARYAGGEAYGAHVDDALMGTAEPGGPIRTDVAVTVFLAAPETYADGALIIEDSSGEQAFKLAAGDAIAYPATSLHRVAPVTEGERLVAVTWVQSLIRDPAQREILFDLENARQQVFAQQGKSATFDLLAKTHANLMRRWAET